MLVPGLLLDALRHGWKLELRQVPPSPDMARSPLQPILVRAVKEASADRMPPHIAFIADRFASSPNAEQLADIAKVIYFIYLSCSFSQSLGCLVDQVMVANVHACQAFQMSSTANVEQNLYCCPLDSHVCVNRLCQTRMKRDRLLPALPAKTLTGCTQARG